MSKSATSWHHVLDQFPRSIPAGGESCLRVVWCIRWAVCLLCDGISQLNRSKSMVSCWSHHGIVATTRKYYPPPTVEQLRVGPTFATPDTRHPIELSPLSSSSALPNWVKMKLSAHFHLFYILHYSSTLSRRWPIAGIPWLRRLLRLWDFPIGTRTKLYTWLRRGWSIHKVEITIVWLRRCKMWCCESEVINKWI